MGTPVSGHLAAVAVGSNQGDRRQLIRTAIDRIAAEEGITLLATSTLIETRPVGGPPQGDFLNGAILVETTLEPRQLLASLHRVERLAGRVRQGDQRNGPRPLDLDLLIHGGTLIDEPGLTVPHPRMHERSFVLDPLLEIAPGLQHPGIRATIRQRHERLERSAGDRTP